ncbi:hypothetical protein D9611_012351 [Ephemerocybe angulata]|uniref:Uncharacterized protein n=1 Tax=Ephemerocybe angulata TaxID=980116 RepID=A0A8H5FKC9_9AGAR|nr:hypothetical protein D9611_012351 [Tulosesus angulatus]
MVVVLSRGTGAPLGLGEEDFVTSVSLIVPFYGPTTTNAIGIIIRPIRSKRPSSVLLSTSLPRSILGSSKVHSTSSASNTQPGISQRALEKPNNGGTGGGGRDGSVAANGENRGCLSWGGRGWGAYLGLAYGAGANETSTTAVTNTNTNTNPNTSTPPGQLQDQDDDANSAIGLSLSSTSLGSEDAIHPEPALPIALPMEVTPPALLEPEIALYPLPLPSPPALPAAFTSMTPGSTVGVALHFSFAFAFELSSTPTPLRKRVSIAWEKGYNGGERPGVGWGGGKGWERAGVGGIWGCRVGEGYWKIGGQDDLGREASREDVIHGGEVREERRNGETGVAEPAMRALLGLWCIGALVLAKYPTEHRDIAGPFSREARLLFCVL